MFDNNTLKLLSLVEEMLEITDREMLLPEEESWRERAEEIISEIKNKK